MRPHRSISLIVSEVSSLLLRKPNLMIYPIFGFALVGAKIEGLIHTARCLTDNSIELPAPAACGLSWPGGLSSPAIKTLPCLEEFQQARSVFTLHAPWDVWG